MKYQKPILIAIFSFLLISEASCATKKAATCPSQKELNELTLILTKYGNNSEGVPPLHYAILKKDMKAVDLLLKHGADPLARYTSKSCLYYAIMAGSMPLIDKFIALENSVIDMANREKHEKHHSFDALYAALVTNQYEAAKYFIISGLLPSDIIEQSFLFLIHPSEEYKGISLYQKKTLLKLMIEHGADINIKTCRTSDKTPLEYLIMSDPSNTEMADFLRSLGAE